MQRCPASAPSTPTPPAPTAPPDPRALVGGQLAMLSRLAEIGMEIAEAAGRLATAAPDPTADASPLRDPALTYVRAARAVRLTIALQSRLMADLAALDRGETAARRERVRRLVLRAAETREAAHDREDEAAYSEARERLDDLETDAELDGLPLAEAVARICRDLGLPADETARIVAAVDPPGSWPAITPPPPAGHLRSRASPTTPRGAAHPRGPPH